MSVSRTFRNSDSRGHRPSRLAVLAIIENMLREIHRNNCHDVRTSAAREARRGATLNRALRHDIAILLGNVRDSVSFARQARSRASCARVWPRSCLFDSPRDGPPACSQDAADLPSQEHSPADVA
jgi:hypothetical protein